MDTLILAARVGLSLAAVLGLMWWLSRRMQSTTLLRRRRRETLTVLGRQQLGKQTGVALIEASGRRLVIGYGDHGVTLLHDAGDAPEAEEPDQPGRVAAAESTADLDTELLAMTQSGTPGAPVLNRMADEASQFNRVAQEAAHAPIRSTSARTADARRPRSPLEGSILAPDTWRKAVVAAQERTTRRS